MKKYRNLSELLSGDMEAGQFFHGLPDYIQDMISDRSDSVHTFSTLRSYADNLLSGNK